MVLFMVFAELYGAFQLLALASVSRTIRWRTMLAAFIVGFSACALMTLGMEAGWGKLFATLSGHSLSSTKAIDAYTSDPFIEEICKALPLLLLLAIGRVRRQLGLADTLLIGAALGCGFGFIENALRFTHSPSAATWVADGGYWQIPVGLTFVLIPGLPTAVGSWLPPGAEQHSLFEPFGQISGTNVHLAWSALVGLSVGIVLRGRGKWKWAALVPFLIACLSHVGANAAIAGASFAGPFAALAKNTALFALLALVVAAWADRQIIVAALRDEAGIRLAAERGEPSDAISVVSARTRNPWGLMPLWSFVRERRSFALVKAAMADDARLAPMRARLASWRTSLERNDPVAAPAFLKRFVQAGEPSAETPAKWHLRLTRRNVLVLLLALPPLVYFVLGNFAATAGLQALMARAIVFPALMLLLVLSMIWRGVTLVQGGLALPDVLRRAQGETVMARVFSLLTTLGGLGFGAISAARFLSGNGALQPALPFAHFLEAIGQGALIGLAMAALLALLAPEIIAGLAAGLAEAAVAGEEAFAFWTGGEAIAGAAASEYGTVLGETALGQAAQAAADAMEAAGEPWEAIRQQIWEPVSRLFAESVSGTPTAMINNMNPLTVWSEVEFPTLMNNPEVDAIAIKYMDGAAALTEDLWFEMGDSWASGGTFFPVAP
jgi:hypothetical protein